MRVINKAFNRNALRLVHFHYTGLYGLTNWLTDWIFMNFHVFQQFDLYLWATRHIRNWMRVAYRPYSIHIRTNKETKFWTRDTIFSITLSLSLSLLTFFASLVNCQPANFVQIRQVFACLRLIGTRLNWETWKYYFDLPTFTGARFFIFHQFEQWFSIPLALNAYMSDCIGFYKWKMYKKFRIFHSSHNKHNCHWIIIKKFMSCISSSLLSNKCFD